jgi:hypothetical protein
MLPIALVIGDLTSFALVLSISSRFDPKIHETLVRQHSCESAFESCVLVPFTPGRVCSRQLQLHQTQCKSRLEYRKHSHHDMLSNTSEPLPSRYSETPSFGRANTLSAERSPRVTDLDTQHLQQVLSFLGAVWFMILWKEGDLNSHFSL